MHIGFGGHDAEGKPRGIDLELDEILIALFSVWAWWRGGSAHAATSAAATKGDSRKERVMSVARAVFSREDDSAFNTLMARLTRAQQAAIACLKKRLNRVLEWVTFRVTIIGMAVPEEAVIEIPHPKDQTRTIKKTVKVVPFSENDPRVQILREIADLMDDPSWGSTPEERARKTADLVRGLDLASKNKSAQHVRVMFRLAARRSRRMLRNVFGTKSLDDIVDTVVNRLDPIPAHIDASRNRIVRQYGTGEMYPSFWRTAVHISPFRTGILVGGIAVVVAAMIIF